LSERHRDRLIEDAQSVTARKSSVRQAAKTEKHDALLMRSCAISRQPN